MARVVANTKIPNASLSALQEGKSYGSRKLSLSMTGLIEALGGRFAPGQATGRSDVGA
jgi:hypothetical protein